MTTATVGGRLSGLLKRRRFALALVAALALFPFVIAIVVDGAGPAAVWNNAQGNSRFLQGLAIEIFILALFALSYDLLIGVTGILSFGHAMFFAAGAYGFGVALKSFEWHWVVDSCSSRCSLSSRRCYLRSCSRGSRV